MPEKIDYELDTEIEAAITKKKKIKKAIIELTLVVIAAVAVAAISVPAVFNYLEKEKAVTGLKMAHEVFDAQLVQYETQASFAVRISSLGLFLPKNKTNPPSPKCDDHTCLFSGDFSYITKGDILLVTREYSAGENANYYFKAKLFEGEPIYCYAHSEKASLVCESIGCTFLPTGDKFRKYYEPVNRSLQVFTCP